MLPRLPASIVKAMAEARVAIDDSNSTLRVIYATRGDDALILRKAREQIAGCARLFPPV